MEDGLGFVVDLAYMQLVTKATDPSFYSSKNLEVKGDNAGWYLTSFGKYNMISQLLVIANGMGDAARPLFESLAKIARPLEFLKMHPPVQEDAGEGDHDDGADKDTGNADDSLEWQNLQGAHKRVYQLARDLYSSEYDADLIKMAKPLGRSSSKTPGVQDELFLLLALAKSALVDIAHEPVQLSVSFLRFFGFPGSLGSVPI